MDASPRCDEDVQDGENFIGNVHLGRRRLVCATFKAYRGTLTRLRLRGGRACRYR